MSSLTGELQLSPAQHFAVACTLLPVWSFCIWWHFGVQILSPNSDLAVALLAIASTTGLLVVGLDVSGCMRRQDVLGLAGYGALLFLIATFLKISLNTPLFAWDALGGEWGVHSYAEQAVRINNPGFAGDAALEPRHPPFTPYLLALSYKLNDLLRLQLTPGAIVWMMAIITPISLVSCLNLKFRATTLVPFIILFFVTTPILENNLAIFGYSEPFILGLTQTIFLLLFIVAESNFRQGWPTLILAISTSISLLMIKSLAIIFFMSLWASYFICRYKSSITLSSLFLYAIFLLISIKAISLIPNVNTSHYFFPNLSFESENIKIMFSGRVSHLTLANLPQSLISIFHAVLINASYSLFFATWLFFLTLGFARPLASKRSRFIAILSFMLLSLFVLAASSDYVLSNGYWGSDTLLSRSLLPCLAVFPLVLISIMYELSYEERN